MSNSTTSPSMQHFIGKMTVTVHRARDLTNANLMTTMDPFAVLYLQKEKFKTKVHKDGGLHPQWEQSFLFNVDCKGDELFHVDVMSSGTLSNDKIGRMSIDMAKFVHAKGKIFYKLSCPDNFQKIAGNLELTVEYNGLGADPTPAPAVLSPPSQPAAPVVSPTAATPSPSPVSVVSPPVSQQQPAMYPSVTSPPPQYPPQQAYNTQQQQYPPQQPYPSQTPAYNPYATAQPSFAPQPQPNFSQPAAYSGYGAPAQTYAPVHVPVAMNVCRVGHPMTFYQQRPANYRNALNYNCDLCAAERLSFSNTFWHCDVCGNYDVCPGCAANGRCGRVV